MDIDDVIVGTIGAYDYKDDQIEMGFSVVPGWQGRGLATEALKKVLEYLTKNEGIPCVTAWCAAENIGSKRVLEKAGMKLVIAGTKDMIRKEHTELIAASIPAAELVFIKGNHFIASKHPEEFNRAVLDFLQN